MHAYTSLHTLFCIAWTYLDVLTRISAHSRAVSQFHARARISTRRGKAVSVHARRLRQVVHHRRQPQAARPHAHGGQALCLHFPRLRQDVHRLGSPREPQAVPHQGETVCITLLLLSSIGSPPLELRPFSILGNSCSRALAPLFSSDTWVSHLAPHAQFCRHFAVSYACAPSCMRDCSEVMHCRALPRFLLICSFPAYPAQVQLPISRLRGSARHSQQPHHPRCVSCIRSVGVHFSESNPILFML